MLHLIDHGQCLIIIIIFRISVCFCRSIEWLFMMVVDNLLLLTLRFNEFVYLYRSSGKMLSIMIMDNLLLPLSVGLMDSAS